MRRDSLKMTRETLCVAQAAIGNSPFSRGNRADEHMERLGRMIEEIDRNRPLGRDGKHGNRHTATCGCEDKPGSNEVLSRIRQEREDRFWMRLALGLVIGASAIGIAVLIWAGVAIWLA